METAMFRGGPARTGTYSGHFAPVTWTFRTRGVVKSSPTPWGPNTYLADLSGQVLDPRTHLRRLNSELCGRWSKVGTGWCPRLPDSNLGRRVPTRNIIRWLTCGNSIEGQGVTPRPGSIYNCVPGHRLAIMFDLPIS
jgi:hypothetical protein